MKQATSTDMGLFLLRLGLGGIMLAHGLQKLGVIPGDPSGIEATVEFMATLGIPSWLAYLSILAEAGGGLALILGLFGKLAAFGIAVNMAVSIYKVHLNAGFFNPDGVEFPLALFTMAMALMLSGMGALSLDSRMAARMDKTISGKKAEEAPPPS